VEEHGVPALQKMVENDEVTVSAAAELARRPEAEQKAVLAGGPQAVKEKARQLRQAHKAGGATDGGAAGPGRADVVEVRRDTEPVELADQLIVLLGEERAGRLRDALDCKLRGKPRGGQAVSGRPRAGRRKKSGAAAPNAAEETKSGEDPVGVSGPGSEPAAEVTLAPDVAVVGDRVGRGRPDEPKAASTSPPMPDPSAGP
jgi:hypothetical protein